MKVPWWVETSGWVGITLGISAFVLLSARFFSDESLTYWVMNFFGAIGVGIDTFAKGSNAVGVGQIVWGCAALYAIGCILL